MLAGMVVAVVCVAAMLVVREIEFHASQASAASAHYGNPTTNPAYADYQFGETDRVIDIGIQPMWLPIGIVTEVMRRDRVLHETLAREGVSVRFHPFFKGADVNAFLARGDLEAGIGGDMPAITACVSSGVVVASLADQNFTSIVADRAMPLEELRGKRIGYALGSNAHYALLQALAAVQLREADVDLVPMDVDAMPKALEEGSIDAFSAWEPTPSIALARIPKAHAIGRRLSSGYLYFANEFFGKHPNLANEILASQIRALTWIAKSPRELHQASEWVQEATRTFLKVSPPLSVEEYATIGLEGLRRMGFSSTLPKTDFDAQSRILEAFEFLKDIGKISREISWPTVRSCFDDTLMTGVLQSSPGHAPIPYQPMAGQ